MIGMRAYRFPALMVFLFTAAQAFSQITVTSGFIQDSIKIGAPVQYYLTARYPQQWQVLFPDSTYTFTPFEFKSKRFFPTQTTGETSYDSTVYELLTFEIAAVQYLELPVFVVQASDCTRYISPRDSIALQLLVREPVPDTVTAENLPLITRTYYERVRWLFNYPLTIGIIIALIILGVLAWIIFGKRIKKYLTIRRISKRYQSFERRYADICAALSDQFSAVLTENAVALWKEYMEFLEKKPYTKLTTREITLTEKDEKLGNSLRAADKAIYGRETAVEEPLKRLGELAMERTKTIIESINHGASNK